MYCKKCNALHQHILKDFTKRDYKNAKKRIKTRAAALLQR